MAENKNQVRRIVSAPKSILNYFKESFAELKKVSWPSRETTVQYTIIVAVASVAAGLVIGGLDFLLALALEKILL